ncbi:MAG: exodeoxyribonuclease V subunit gamma [Neisseriaceae bacterium]
MVHLLSLHQSNQMDVLIALLEKFYLLKQAYFKPEPIIVHTEGMEHYLRKNLSKRLGVVANLEFKKPSAFFWEVAQTILPHPIPEADPFKKEVLLWRILSLFQSATFAKEEPTVYRAVNNYLQRHQIAAYDLAYKLADLFNQYLIYRPAWIASWSQGKFVLEMEANEQAWQQKLWCYLLKQINERHRVQIWSELQQILCKKKLPKKISLPNQVHLFAMTSLPPLYLDLMHLLSKHIPVHLFILSPCQENWSDHMLPHPLLQSLGQQGKEFFSLLFQYPAILEQNLYFSPCSADKRTTLLHCLQKDILYLNDPSNLSSQLEDVPALLEDNSIQIHSAHSPVRELQILKNQLLYYLDKHPKVSLEQIVVLSPNIELYLPYLEGIFGENAHDHFPIPFSIADVKLKETQLYSRAIQHILRLIDSRFDVKSVLELLSNPLIRKKFLFSILELNLITKILDWSNISWGLDEAHRQRHLAVDHQFTWEKGLARLKKIVQEENDNALFTLEEFLLALGNTQVTSKDCEELKITLEKFFIFIKTLSNIYSSQNERSFSLYQWLVSLKQISNQLISLDKQTQIQQAQLFEMLSRVSQASRLAQYTKTIKFPLFKYIIERTLEEHTKTGTLRGGITFSNLRSMRTIPFQFTALIGLNQQDFPQAKHQLSFDLVQKYPQNGDLSHRKDERYQFLEAIISTQECLYLSFVGRSLQNRLLNPSPVIDELIDLVSQMTHIPNEKLQKKWIQQHPLQNFSRKYFEANNGCPHYTYEYRAAHASKACTQSSSFLLEYPVNSPSHLIMSLQDWLKFWKSPLQFWAKHELQIQAPHLSQPPDFSEPFSLKKNISIYENSSRALNTKGQWLLQNIFKALSQQKELKRIQMELQHWDSFPSGKLGEVWKTTIVQSFERLLDTPLPHLQIKIKDYLASPPNLLNFEIILSGLTLQATIDSIFNDTLILFDKSNRLHDSTILQAFLKHLVYTSHYSEANTYLLSLDSFIHFKKLTSKQANKVLSLWASFTQKGLTQPLPLIYPTSFKLAAALYKQLGPQWLWEEWFEQDAPSNLLLTEVLKFRASPQVNKILQENLPVQEHLHELIFGEAKAITDYPLFWEIIQELLLPFLAITQKAHNL